MRKSLGRLAVLVSVCASVSCGEARSDEELGTSADSLDSEMLGVAEGVWRHYETNPSLAIASYAIARTNPQRCGAAMIGPNIMMTAAHCSLPTDVVFRQYRSSGFTSYDTEIFSCEYLTHTGPDSDLLLAYCGPNSAGVSPGDKYGYLDLDTTGANVGQAMYSIWANGPNGGSLPSDARLYSPGTVTATDASEFYPNGDVYCWPSIKYDGNDLYNGVMTNLWGEPGTSGSPQLDAATHRIVIGPTSVVPDPSGQSRCAVSMRDYLYWGFAAGDSMGWVPTINETKLSALGLDPANYSDDWLDKDFSWGFDVQEDLESLHGENARGWYDLGFASERRSRLWDLPDPGVFVEAGLWLRLLRPQGSAPSHVASHRRLNLAPGTYRVSVDLYSYDGASSSQLWIGTFHEGNYTDGGWLDTTPGLSWRTFTTTISPQTANSELVIWAEPDEMDMYIRNIVIAREGEVMNMDTADKRAYWRNGAQITQIPPKGRESGPNWALRVVSTNFTANNEQLALISGQAYRICFDARTDGSFLLPPNTPALIELVSGGASAMQTTVTVTPTWSSFCSATFTPTSSNNNLRMRATLPSKRPFLVDNISIQKL